MIERLPERKPWSHKGDYGHALIIAGSRSMPGAAALAAQGALRGGAGLVTVATASSCYSVVAGVNPCAMTVGLPEDSSGRISSAAATRIQELAGRATCVAIGPGLGRSPELTKWIRQLFTGLQIPMVMDADAITALSEGDVDFRGFPAPRIFTPHEGEMRRLVGAPTTDRTALESQADRLAAFGGAVILLKGHESFVTDGRHQYRNRTGHPAMATGGSGDVLTGLIAALICQEMTPWSATCLAACVHGLAGELAAKEIGPVGVIATDIAARIPAALQRATNQS
jgi:NAD(P)H-hydrate epimerase